MFVSYRPCRSEEACRRPGRGERRRRRGDGAVPAAKAGRGGLVEGRCAEARRGRCTGMDGIEFYAELLLIIESSEYCIVTTLIIMSRNKPLTNYNIYQSNAK